MADSDNSLDLSEERWGKLFSARLSVIQNQKPNLATCALGAGVVHALIRASVLPVLITLSAPDDLAYRTVPVAVRTALPVPVASAPGSGEFAEVLMFGEGDVEELVLPAPVPLAGSGPDLPAQRALTERIPLIEQAGLSGAVRAPARPETIAPVLSQGARSAEGVEVSIVARLPDFMPAAVPHPKPKPKFKPDAASLKTAPAAAERKKPLPVSKKKAGPKPPPKSRPVARARPQPAPRPSRPVASARPQPAPKQNLGGFLGGGPAATMKEFPLPASR